VYIAVLPLNTITRYNSFTAGLEYEIHKTTLVSAVLNTLQGN